jgi:HlyD family secretion protein
MNEEPSKKKRPPKILFVILILGMAVFVASRIFQLTRPFRYAGTLEATKVDLSAQLASSIRTVQVREGDHVNAHQELVQLACEDIQVASQIAAENYNRTLRLYKAGSASRESLDQVKNRKDDNDVKLGWCRIQSPIQGTVLSRYHEPGEWVGPGVKLLTLANIRDIWTYIYVPQPEVSNLQVGMKLAGFLPELNDRRFEGHIIKINEEAEFTPKNVQTRSERTRLVFGVKVSFWGANEEEILKPGMTIEIALPES